jgi:hypothetical protein
MVVVESATRSYSGTCFTYDDDDGNEEVCTKVEDAIDIKEEVCMEAEQAIDITDETLETIYFPSIKTEQEVRLWGVC